MTEVPPGHAVLAALQANPDTAVKAVIVGGIGTGKSTTLAAFRDILRAAGVVTMNRPPRPDDSPRAVLIDDAHTLSEAELTVLCDLAADPSVTLVVASEPRTRRPALRTLIAAVERDQPRIALGPLPRWEVDRRFPGGLDTVMSATAGLPFLLKAVPETAVALGDIGTLTRAVHAALIARLREYDESALAAFLVMSLDDGLGPTDLAATLGTDHAGELADTCYASGLLDTTHPAEFRMAVHRAAERLLGGTRHREIETALLCSQENAAVLSTTLAITLAEHGFRHPRLSAVLERRAADPDGPPNLGLLRCALMTSQTPAPHSEALALRLADATAGIGECATATGLADGLLSSGDAAHRAAAVRIAASVATHDGNTGHAAELYGWLGQTTDYRPTESDRAAGTIVFLATGNPDAARELLGMTGAGPPTSAARGSRQLAQGLMSTLDQPYPIAAARLGQAVGAAPHTAASAMPDSMPALVALTALHSGDSARARSVLARAGDTDAMFGHRHRLLLAWTQMQEGRLQSAASILAEEHPGSHWHRRDALWAAALQTAIARRSGDTGALQRHWEVALDVLTEYCVDLFALLPIGELWVGAARLRQTDQLTHVLDQAFAVLAALGDPPAWSMPLHWAGVHAAILANTPGAMSTHGQALSVAAEHSGFAAALAAGGRAWLRVLARAVDADELAAAARGLSRFGLGWDATRLAGQAALQATDPKVSAAMLQIARELKLAAGPDEPPESGAADRSASSLPVPDLPAGRGRLSDREREVAELLLLGLPYRDIGAQLFISAKTVEHHVARIRRRLGAESRSDLLSMLRAMLTPSSQPT